MTAAALVPDRAATMTKVEVAEAADPGFKDKGRTEPAFSALLDRMYNLHLSRLITPQAITAATLDAVRENKHSVRLPRRLSPASMVPDAFRRMSQLLARGLTTPPPPLPKMYWATRPTTQEIANDA